MLLLRVELVNTIAWYEKHCCFLFQNDDSELNCILEWRLKKNLKHFVHNSINKINFAILLNKLSTENAFSITTSVHANIQEGSEGMLSLPEGVWGLL